MEFKNWLIEHDYLKDLDPLSHEKENDRANALNKFFPDGDTYPQINLENKRIVMSKYRQPPIVIPYKGTRSDKPKGGLWYGEGNEWISFIQYNIPNLIAMFVHEIFINPSRMCIIHDEKTLEDFTWKYRLDAESEVIDWDKVASEFDGIECFGNGFDKENWQYSWDVPSGCIWNNTALKDSKLLSVYDVHNKKFRKANELGVYAGNASKIKNPIR
jgi:hypothetical protein